MSAVPITITGILTTENGSGTATLVGIASLTGLGVGGGPIVPDEKPPGIWGPTDPRPTPPIHLPGNPPGTWGGGSEPFPTPPIHIPPPPVDIPPGDNMPDGMVKNPPTGGGWGYNATFGWGYFPGTSGAGPK